MADAGTLADGRMNRQAAASYLGCSVSWLDHQSAIGHGPALVRLGSKVWYYKTDLDAYLMAHRSEPKCLYSATGDLGSGGAASRSGADHIESALGRQIADRLRSKNVGYGHSENPKHLTAVRGARST